MSTTHAESDQPTDTLDAFLGTLHAVRCDLAIEPRKEHIATCINYADLLEMRDDFVRELTNTIPAFVYSEEKQRRLVEVLQQQGRSQSSAWSQLIKLSHQKFRRSSLQGQFSELLLCNLLQHYFKASPLLRKMPITTNPALERNGADAIHIARVEGRHVLYLGEAKTYNRKADSLKDALVTSIRDIVEHHANHRNELALYTFDDFIPVDLESIAQDYLAGKRQLEVHLVCIVTYDDKNSASGLSRDDLLEETINGVKREAASATSHPVFREIPAGLMPRMNYIVFPIRAMNDVIDAFTHRIQHA